MGLSVAIAGGIILSVLMLVMMSITGLAGNIFSIGSVTTQVSDIENSIDDTDISLETLFASTTPRVNFTLNNDDKEKLWNFDEFNVLIEYESASGDELEELSYGGDCQGTVPSVGEWCIEGIAGDFLDAGILNEGESAEVWTQVSQNLASGNARVTVSTDNGEVAMLPAPKRSWFDANPVPPATCEFSVYGRTFVDTDTGVSYVCDPSRDKWLSIETMAYWGDETETCSSGNDIFNDDDCSVDFGQNVGSGLGVPDSGLYIPYNMTIISYALSMVDDDCDTFDFNIQLGGTESNLVDEPYINITNIAFGLTGEMDVNDNLDIDVNGTQFIIWGIDNNCGQTLDDFVITFYSKWHHDDP